MQKNENDIKNRIKYILIFILGALFSIGIVASATIIGAGYARITLIALD